VKKSTEHRGVSWDFSKQKWTVGFTHKLNKVSVGTFHSEEAAGRVRMLLLLLLMATLCSCCRSCWCSCCRPAAFADVFLHLHHLQAWDTEARKHFDEATLPKQNAFGGFKCVLMLVVLVVLVMLVVLLVLLVLLSAALTLLFSSASRVSFSAARSTACGSSAAPAA